MSAELAGITLERFEDPIRIALATYQEIANNGLKFDGESACKLVLTPGRPNSARTATDIIFQKDKIGTLYVIAFKPGDGTGAEVGQNYQLKDLIVDPPYPRADLIVPRSKAGIYHEGHLTIARHKTEDVHAEPQLYAGTFDLLGLDGNCIRKIGELGHPETTDITSPIATFTVGYRGSERFGDPHAVYSGISNVIQICAFLAISDEIHQKYPNILDGLIPQLPFKE